MLNFFFLKKNLFNFFQSGLYFDFIFKKIAELFVRNLLVYTGIFFCEKYLIEFFTKKYLDSFLFFSKILVYPIFFYESFFSQVTFILFYAVFFLEFFFYFL